MLIAKRVLLKDVDEAKKFISSKEALLIPSEYVDSLFYVKHAYYQAKKAFDRGNNIAKNLKYEFLLRLLGETQVKDALDIIEKNTDDFVFICWTGGIYPQFKKHFVKKELKLREHPKDLEKIQRAALLSFLR